MTVEIDVYCKREPRLGNLIKALNCQKAQVFEGYNTYRWFPDGHRISIIVNQNGPKVFSEAYDRELIDDNIGLARFAGVDVPDALIRKFMRDNLFNQNGVRTFIVGEGGESPNDPASMSPSCTDLEAYTIQADAELNRFDKKYPLLAGVDPYFKLPFGLARFSQGHPLYHVELETTTLASQKTFEEFVELSEYIQKKWDGIIYCSDVEKFGTPDARALYDSSSTFAAEVVSDLKNKGARIISPQHSFADRIEVALQSLYPQKNKPKKEK